MSVDVIHSIVVGIPARNEQRRIVRSVRSVLAAVASLPASIDVAVSVASDDSTDATNAHLDELAAEHASVHVVHGVWHSAGAARRAAIAHGLGVNLERDGPMHGTWIATTDADTVVPPEWLLGQIRRAEEGWDGLAGVVDIAEDDESTSEAIAAFRTMYTLGPATHPHVHGANMGVRASAYLAIGGFPAIPLSEDHALWNELRDQRYRLLSPLDMRVITSPRRIARAIGGFADTLARAMASPMTS